MSSDAFLLGAGFSRAVSRHMPTLQELGEQVQEKLNPYAPAMPPSMNVEDFENWLSYLSEDEPWLRPEEHLRNRSVFQRVSRVLCSIIQSKELATRQSALPGWLRSLVAYWHQHSSPVITFNYDVLVEAAYTEVVTVRSQPGSTDNYVSPTQLYRAPLTPISARLGAALAASRVDTMQLLKLHGSRTWWYSGRESFYGEMLFDATLTDSWSNDRALEDRWLLEDKVPLVVPPTNGKSGFFNNETVRLQWQMAFSALLGAQRVWVIGYSMPETDLMARFLLQSGVGPGKRLMIVNPDPEVADRLQRILPRVTVDRTLVCADPLEEMSRRISPADTAPTVILKD